MLLSVRNSLIYKNMDSGSTAHAGLNSRDLRRVYLITYSQADVDKFPTRASFAEAVIAAFSKVNNLNGAVH